MNRSILIGISLLLALSPGAAASQTLAQQPASQSTDGRASTRSSDEISLSKLRAQARPKRRPFFSLMPEIATANLNPVIGSGTPGFVSRWQGVSDSFTYTLGNSNIFEDKYGKIGIGTTAPASLLTVQGMVETTLGGYKFPDGTLQTTAGISFVTHDTSLAGLGTQASPLGIALGGVQTVHLANSAVTPLKIANGTVIRSLNGLSDNVSLTAGSNITITATGNSLTVASPGSLSSVAHDSTLSGNGTTASPLKVADSGIDTPQLANGAVTLSKIALNQVVTRINNLTESVTLAAGPNISITPSGNTLTIAGSASGATAFHAVDDTFFVLTSPGRNVISKQVPAGSYFISFRISLQNTRSSPQTASCTLSTGDSATIRLDDEGDGDQGVLVLQDVATFSVPTTITVHCIGFEIFTQGRIVMTALKVGSIQ
jgi:hypothetical protein